MKRYERHKDAVLFSLIALASLLLYLRTLAPDVVDADGGEFQFAAWNFGFVHPTGYPLYLILGGIVQHVLPIGNPAYRLNLFTAFTGSIAVGAVYLVIKELTSHRPAALIGAACFALTRVLWYDSSGAEVYALNAFFLALLVYLALRWQGRPSAGGLAAFAFVYGLGLTHHRSVILWIPAFAAFFVLASWRLGKQVARPLTAWAALLFVLPLLLYLYIPLRAPASPYAVLNLAPDRQLALYDNSFGGFTMYLSGQVFEHELKWDAASVARLVDFPGLLLAQFGPAGIIVGIIGLLAFLARRNAAQLALMVIGLAASLLFAAIYHIGDIAHYYLPAYFVWATWIGIGVATILGALPWRGSRSALAHASGIALAALALPAFQIASNLPAADRSNETGARAQWNAILASPIPENAILLSNDRDEMMPMWYTQYVEGRRRDLIGLFPLITSAPEYANIVRLTDAMLTTGRPVFFVKPMPGLEIKYRLAAVGPSPTRVVGQAAAQQPEFPSSAVLADRLGIIGYDVSEAADSLRVGVYWQARSKIDCDCTTFVHLVRGGVKIAQGNDHQAGGEFYPSSMWPVGEIVRDEQVLALPAGIGPGPATLFAGMYRYPEMEMLGDPVPIGTIVLK